MLTRVFAYLKGLLRRNAIDAEVNDELRFHIEMETQANVERGMTPTEARRVALRDLGGVNQTREEVHDVRVMWFDSLARDFRDAWRSIGRRPVASACLVLTLSMGQAVSASLFAVLDGLVFKSLPFREPAGLFVVGPRSQLNAGRPASVRPDELETFARHPLVKGAFGVCLTYGYFPYEYANAEGIRDSSITTGFFDVLGVVPVLGRPLGRVDAVKTEPRPAVISYALWQARFGGDSGLLNRTIMLANRRVTIVGVMPRGFDFPRATNVWVADVPSPRMAYLTAVVRLSPDDGPRLTLKTSRETCIVRPLRTFLDPGGTSGVVALFLATGVAVVMAWIHLGGLQLAQALARARETATRLALGARPGEIVRQWVVETFTLCGSAFVAGVVALPALLALFVHLLPAEMSLGQPIAVDWRTLGFLGALTAFGGVVLVIGPLTVLRQTRLNDVLHGGLPAFGAGGVARARWLLLAGQVGLLTAMLYVAGLAVLSLDRLNRTDVGFETANLFQVDLPESASDATGGRFLQVQQRVSALPFVSRVARGGVPLLAGRMPVSLLATKPQRIEDLARHDGLEWWVSRGYFRTVGARIIEGSDMELENRRDAALLSVASARILRLTPPVVGTRIFVSGLPYTVIGVVADVLAYGPDQPPAPYVYVAKPEGAMVVRTTRAPEDVVPAVVQAIRDVTGEKGPIKATLASDLVAKATAAPRSRSILLSVLALASLALGMVAIFSATNELVRRRLRDTAVRMVLGADSTRVIQEMVGRAIAVVSVGLASGLAAGTIAGEVAANLFVALPSDRAGAACAVVGLLLAASAVAAFGPAYRAARTDPLVVLRHE